MDLRNLVVRESREYEDEVEYRTSEEIDRLTAPDVNYMELREPAGAFSCGTCSWAKDGHCTHARVDANVSADHGCCNLFDPASGPPVFPPNWEAPQ